MAMTKKQWQELENETAEKLWAEAMEFYTPADFHVHSKQLNSCQARVLTRCGYTYLKSYNTLVAVYDEQQNTVIDMLRKVYGYTATSAQHITKFKRLFPNCAVLTWR